jgi:hypothetical protein
VQRKHGGPGLGPTRACESWRKLGVDGRGLADAPPPADAPADHMPRLTRDMAAIVQEFPLDWRLYGRKTASYRQVGNAFPPPVTQAVGTRIRLAIQAAREIADQPLQPEQRALAEDPAPIFLRPRHERRLRRPRAHGRAAARRTRPADPPPRAAALLTATRDLPVEQTPAGDWRFTAPGTGGKPACLTLAEIPLPAGTPPTAPMP